LGDTLFNLSNVFLTELFLSSGSSEIDWHAVLTAESFNSSGREFMDSLQPGIDKGFVRYVMDILPNTWPDFLPKA